VKVKDPKNIYWFNSTLPISSQLPSPLPSRSRVHQYFYFYFFNHKTIEAQVITTWSQDYRNQSSQKPTLGGKKTNSG